MALPLAWLAGVAWQLRERELMPFAAYVALAARIALAAPVVAALLRGGSCRRARRLRVGRLAGVAAPCRDAAAGDRGPRHRGHRRRRQPAAAGPSGLRFRFVVDRDGAPAGVPATLALGWYAGYDEDAALVQPRQALRAGQRWRFMMRLGRPHGNLNPNGFDYELALFEQGIRATGYVCDTAAPTLPGAVWTLPVAPLWAQLAGLVAAALLVLPVPWRAEALALPLGLALLVPPRELPADGDFDGVAADIGQETAVLVRTRRHGLLFDAGPPYSRESDAGQRVLVPLLRGWRSDSARRSCQRDSGRRYWHHPGGADRSLSRRLGPRVADFATLSVGGST